MKSKKSAEQTPSGGMNHKAGVFFRAPKWQREFEKLRAIVLDCKLDEEMKWGWPCYSLGGTT